MRTRRHDFFQRAVIASFFTESVIIGDEWW
jgi:hypothetical protein